MAITDGFKDIFMAGIGALAITGERGKEIIDQLIEKGEITVEQGKQLNTELQHKANEATSDIRSAALEALLKSMSPEDREQFVADVAAAAEAAKVADPEPGEVEVEPEPEPEQPAEAE